MPVKITSLRKTCSACPSQWEGETSDGRAVYIRYRWGGLSLGIGKTIEQAISGPYDVDLYWGSRDGMDGYMRYAELKTRFTDEIDWPETDGVEKEEGF